jgi:lysyl-tRNA synthetase class 2
MDDTNSLIEQRRAKLAALEAKGIQPFRNAFKPDTGCGTARERFEKGELVEGASVLIAGRITAHRDMGKSQFIDLKDITGRIQVYAQKQAIGDEQFEVFKQLDLADFIGAKGTLFRTRTGEPSVKLESFIILSKALRPPPAKWEGLADPEIRYRQRYLDLISSDEVKATFLKRSMIVREIRAFFHERGYVEVETPMMQAIPGGAAAQPFKTHHNALGCEFYLRIALELYLKRLLVGGIDKVFEIGRNFRNEGLSRRHNPEFTMLEAYEAYGDYATMMETVESLVKRIAERVVGKLVLGRTLAVEPVRRLLEDALNSPQAAFGPGSLWGRFEAEQAERFAFLQSLLTQAPETVTFAEVAKARAICVEFKQWYKELHPEWNQQASLPVQIQAFNRLERALRPYSESEIDLNVWNKPRYRDLVRQAVSEMTEGLFPDWFALSPEDRKNVAVNQLGLGGDIAAAYEDFEVTGAVFEKLVEPTLIQPTFVTHFPKQLVPLAKLDPNDPTSVEVFECCINGQEISPGYSEQNDPVAQREALEHQAGGEQQKLDEDFLAALEHGMPPAGGIGIGIDRLCMMLLGQESIRDVILFPQLRPKV